MVEELKFYAARVCVADLMITPCLGTSNAIPACFFIIAIKVQNVEDNIVAAVVPTRYAHPMPASCYHVFEKVIYETFLLNLRHVRRQGFGIDVEARDWTFGVGSCGDSDKMF